jgi:hypothetical protein
MGEEGCGCLWCVYVGPHGMPVIPGDAFLCVLRCTPCPVSSFPVDVWEAVCVCVCGGGCIPNPILHPHATHAPTHIAPPWAPRHVLASIGSLCALGVLQPRAGGSWWSGPRWGLGPPGPSRTWPCPREPSTSSASVRWTALTTCLSRATALARFTTRTCATKCLSGWVNVNVNELRLGFSNTTRNPEGILSHNNRKS